MPKITLQASASPRASILVLSRRNAGRLRACLSALQRNIAEVAFEVIVLLNDADAEVVALCEREVVGARVECSDVNLGFPAGTNRLAEQARGEFLVLLNDDTEVEPRWLESLVEAADEHPEAGAIGSRLLFPDRSLQEAGGVVWSDGTTAQVGRGLPPASALHLYVRQVDYCSAASLLVRRSTWDLVGGFDEEFFPGYYEDVDLCLSIREHGQQVLYEPRSRVIHHESSTSDVQLKTAVAPRNVARLRSKWSDRLAAHEPAGLDSPARVERASLRTRGWPRRILIIGDRLPDATGTGGDRRMVHAIRDLRSIPAAITVFSPQQPGDDPEAVARLGCDVLRRDLLEHLATPQVFYDGVILCSTEDSDSLISAIRQLQPQAAVIADAERLAPAPGLLASVDGVVSSSLDPGQPGAWIDVLAQARSRRIDEYV